MRTNAEIFDDFVLRQIRILRFANMMGRTSTEILIQSDKVIRDLIVAKLAGFRGLETQGSIRAMLGLISRVKALRQTAWSKMEAYIIDQIKALIEDQSEWWLETVEPEKKRIPALVALVLSTQFEGFTLKQWINRSYVDDQRRIEAMIRSGMSSAKGSTTIANGAMAAARISRRNVLTIAKTGSVLTASKVNDEILIATEEIQRERYTAVLDSRTTVLCASLDGRVYPVRSGPHPPLHFNCRSMRVPIGQGPQVKETTYADWLKGQPNSVQDEVLGKSRANSFRRNELTLDRFIDETGRELTVKELRRKTA